MLSTIYLITNIVNNKCYIGSTIKTPKERKYEHFYDAYYEKGHKYNYPLYQAIRKYGDENFKFEVLLQVECDENEIRKIEKEYIKKYNSLLPFGYNQTDYTEHPLQDPKNYEKMKETKRENAKRVALIDNDNKIIQIFRSIIDCAEELHIDEKKIGACCRGERKTTQEKRFSWVGENGELLLPEYKRDSYKGKAGTTQIQSTNRAVLKIDMKSNQILEAYDSTALAARENNCDASGIAKVCRGKRKSCGGFNWKYKEDYKEDINV